MYSFKNNLIKIFQTGAKSFIYSANLESQIRPCYFHTLTYRKSFPLTTCSVHIQKPPNLYLYTYSPTVIDKALTSLKKTYYKIRNWNRQEEVFLGLYLYQSLEHIDYREFISTFNLPDTFLSWFVITELHVWMLMVRLQMEGEDGRTARNSCLESFYEDASRRATLLAPLQSGLSKKQVHELCHDLKSALILYDEGLLFDDRTLANTLWYEFFKSDCKDPRHLEVLIHYIRHQVQSLKNWPTADMMKYCRKMEQKSTNIWTDLKPHIKTVYSS